MNKLLNVENRLFTAERICFFGTAGIIIFAFIFSYSIYEQPWPFTPSGYPKCIDFGFFWLSGKLAVAGDTARIFDYPAWSAIQTAFFEPDSCINFNRFYYPPTLLFYTYPLGFMPYALAFAVWIIASFTLFEMSVYAIIPRRAALLAAISPFVLFVNTYLGHTGFLTAGLMGLSLVLMERRPWISGMLLGLLTYKPHFGLLFPIALIASHSWRVIGSAVLSTAVLGALAAMAFGYEGWVQFVDSLFDRSAGLGPAQNVQMILQSIFGVFQMCGASTRVEWTAQLLIASIVVLGIWILWSRPVSHNLGAAALCAGIFLVTPYALSYDLTVLSVAAAFFVKEGLERGFLPGERMTILGCWLALLFLSWRTGPMIAVVLELFILRRIVEYRLSLKIANSYAVG